MVELDNFLKKEDFPKVIQKYNSMESFFSMFNYNTKGQLKALNYLLDNFNMKIHEALNHYFDMSKFFENDLKNDFKVILSEIIKYFYKVDKQGV